MGRGLGDTWTCCASKRSAAVDWTPDLRRHRDVGLPALQRLFRLAGGRWPRRRDPVWVGPGYQPSTPTGPVGREPDRTRAPVRVRQRLSRTDVLALWNDHVQGILGAWKGCGKRPGGLRDPRRCVRRDRP